MAMSWGDFENYCKKIVGASFDENKYRILWQKSKTYADGRERRIDCHVAERRQGGCGIVIECKHYTQMKLSVNQVRQVLDYKKNCRASKAIILISDSTDYCQTFIDEAMANNVEWIVVRTTTLGKIRNRLIRLNRYCRP